MTRTYVSEAESVAVQSMMKGGRRMRPEPAAARMASESIAAVAAMSAPCSRSAEAIARSAAAPPAATESTAIERSTAATTVSTSENPARAFTSVSVCRSWRA